MTQRKQQKKTSPKQKPPAENNPVAVSLSEDMCIAIVMGSAQATYEVVAAQNGASGLPAGRYWYNGGKRPSKDADACVVALAEFIDHHIKGGVSGEALYIQTRREIIKEPGNLWSELPLADRLAFNVFATQLPPLLIEARADIERRRRLAEIDNPPPDRGIYKRVKRGPRRLNRRVKMVHAVKEAAE